MLDKFFNKQTPIQGLAGYGGGAVARLLSAGPSVPKTYVDDLFSVDTWHGTNATRNIETGLDMANEGGMVLLKRRNGSTNPMIYDTLRSTNHLETDGVSGQSSFSGFLTGYNTDGYSIGSAGNINGTGTESVGFSFRKAPGFFDVVTYSGNSQVRNIPHSLGSTPGMIIIKCTNATSHWSVWHRSAGFSYQQRLRLNDNGDVQSGEAFWGDSSTPPNMNASTFSVGTTDEVNTTGRNYVAYIFGHDDSQFGGGGNESIIKCGSWVGDAQTEGPTIDLGFEPQWLITKNVTYTTYNENWTIMDTLRGWNLSNDAGSYKWISTDQTNSESGNAAYRRNHEGFQISGNGAGNINGQTYIYMAIRRGNKPVTVGTDVFQTLTYSGTSADVTRSTNIIVDMLFTQRTTGGVPYALDRFRGGSQYITFSSESSEGQQYSALTDMGSKFLDMGSGAVVNSNSDYCLSMFKRAPGFFDIVSYKGNQTVSQIPHQLGVMPEMIMVKNRKESYYWQVYHSSMGVSYELRLPNDNGKYNVNTWNSTLPTATNFTIGTTNAVNESGDMFIAYLWATLPGISKVGSYTGNDSNNYNIDCGFTTGARFVLIKESSGTGNWWVFDTVRGMNTSLDSRLYLNTNDAALANNDYISSVNNGFTLTSLPGSINKLNTSYIFLAIA